MTASLSRTGAVPALELRDLRRSFRTRDGDVVAVDGVDLVVQPGEVVALLGPNGAGKTTTLDVVLGLTSPTSGTARVLGRSPRGAVRAGLVGAVLQTGGLLPSLTVRETLLYLAACHPGLSGGRGEAADDALHRTGIAHLAGRRVSRCSGGEQQRVRFAAALLADPALVVLDEPTAGMDVHARREFWDVMHAEAAAGRTVVFATHYLEEAEAFADRTVLMAGGRVVADGPTHEVRARALGRTVAVSVPDPDAALAVVAAAVAEAGGAVLHARTDAGRLEVRVSDSDAAARAVLALPGAHDLEVRAGSLEDAFVLLTGRAEPGPEAPGTARPLPASTTAPTTAPTAAPTMEVSR
ncbi:ABC transporter ATP-binding protein [Nocardioides sp. GY 10127]|uniref:ABC transporter ATP-binding protein n=1 Tax=Nocardioides sp. GY 10127 TaxID=2569762 RepID=UPI0010A85C44|nr:ABC transporter ATP-binding protein [Nocardioides sp. GY 10127]TIC84037.1 ABC transporter ATP-binding protein [Nocardioides sp. GY 10127]